MRKAITISALMLVLSSTTAMAGMGWGTMGMMGMRPGAPSAGSTTPVNPPIGNIGTATTGGVVGGGACGWNAGGKMMTNASGFGMMNGLAAAPVVGDDGTAYIVSTAPTATPGSSPTWSSFQSHLLVVPPSGQNLNLTLDGLISKPVISGDTLIATGSLPHNANYSIQANNGATSAQSVIFWLQLPLDSSSEPTAVLMDGRFASVPVIVNDQIYVTTSNFGYGMMQGFDVFNNTYPNYTVSNTSKAYLYVFNMDGTLVSKTVLQ